MEFGAVISSLLIWLAKKKKEKITFYVEWFHSRQRADRTNLRDFVWRLDFPFSTDFFAPCRTRLIHISWTFHHCIDSSTLCMYIFVFVYSSQTKFVVFTLFVLFKFCPSSSIFGYGDVDAIVASLHSWTVSIVDWNEYTRTTYIFTK